jgi:hypothetical protein
MEATFARFPRHGSKFRKKFHGMEAGFGGFSTQWKPVFHGVETPAFLRQARRPAS